MSNKLKQLSHYAKNYYHNRKASTLVRSSNINMSTALSTMCKRCTQSCVKTQHYGDCISGSHCPWTRQCLRHYHRHEMTKPSHSTARTLWLHCVSFGLDTLVAMLFVFVQKTAPFGTFLHRTAFHGTRRLLKLLEQTYSQCPRPCFSRAHYSDHLRYSAVFLQVAQKTVAHSRLTL